GLTTTPFGPSVTPTSAQAAPAAARAIRTAASAGLCGIDMGILAGKNHGMTRRLLRPVTRALSMAIAPFAWAQPPRPKVLAFFTTGGETDHYLFAQDAMRRLGAYAAVQGVGFAATSDWDMLSDAGLKDVRLVICLNDQPHTGAQRDAFRRYMEGGG